MRTLAALAIMANAVCVQAADDARPRVPLVHVEQLPPMCWPRAEHAAVLLADGRVLITGGSAYSDESAIPWAEVFDPATRTFRPTGAMNVPRNGHVAVALDDGRVLVAGGWRAGYVEATATAEVWDPATGVFTLTGPMTIQRTEGMAVARLPGGQVLLLGGTFEGEFGTATAAIDIFDPGTLNFARWGELVMSRSEFGVHWLDPGRLLVFGGGYRCCNAPASEARYRSQEIVDIATHASRRVGDLPFVPAGGDQSSFVAAHGTRIARADNGDIFEFDGSWRRLLPAGMRPPGDARPPLRLTPDTALLAGGDVSVIDLRDGRAENAVMKPWIRSPEITSMGAGRALVSGGALREFPLRDAWLITAQ